MDINNEIKLFESYLRNVKNRSEKTIEAYSQDLREFSRLMAHKDSINEITRADIETSYIENLVQCGNGPSSRARKLSSLRSFFKWAVANELVKENPVENVEMPKIPHKEPKVMDSNEVFDVMLNVRNDGSRESACEGFRNLAIMSLMFNTGVRRSEVIEIKLNDLNLSDSSLLIHGKGNKERVAYFNDTTRAILSEYVLSHRKSLKPSETSEYLFVSKRAEKMVPASINKIVNKYFEAAGVKSKGYTAHSTRKAFATQAYSNTGDIFAVQNLLGHSSPNTTMKYVGVVESKKKAAAMTVNF